MNKPIPFMEKWVYRKLGCEEKDHGPCGREDLDRHKFMQLQETLHYAAERSAFYRARFQEYGVRPEAIRTYGDLAKIPFTTPDDIVSNRGAFSCVPLSAIAKTITFYRPVHTTGTLYSSGTTGPGKRVFYTREDLASIVDFLELCTRVVCHADGSDIVQITLPERRVLGQAELLARGVRAAGCTAIKANAKLGAEEQYAILQQAKSTVLVGIVSYIYRISQELNQRYDLRNTSIHSIVATSEYLSETQRRRLQEIWNCIVYSHYGMAEMGLGIGIECSHRNGVHLNEAGFVAEIIDPDTGDPLNHGDEGELVLTSLSRKAMPLIRYRTGDVTRIIDESCGCGIKNLYRLGKIEKRTNTSVAIQGGDVLHPYLFDDALYQLPTVTDYQISLGKENGKHRIIFTVEVVGEDMRLRKEIGERLMEHDFIKGNLQRNNIREPEITVVGPGALKKDRNLKRSTIQMGAFNP